MFWIVAALVAVVLLALAWWVSGRNRGVPPTSDLAADAAVERAKATSTRNRLSGPSSGLG